MIGTGAAETIPQVDERAALQGTRIVGEVKRIVASDQDERVVLKVTEVVGKATTSKQARAWRGAWITCPPTMLAPLS